jgi:hypothetical protein
MREHDRKMIYDYSYKDACMRAAAAKTSAEKLHSDWLDLRKTMRDYFREKNIEPPEHIKKKIGWR